MSIEILQSVFKNCWLLLQYYDAEWNRLSEDLIWMRKTLTGDPPSNG